MKRLLVFLLLAVCAALALVPVAHARHVVARGGPRHVVVVSHGWPLYRPMRSAIVHPARATVHAEPATYLPVEYWRGSTVAAKSAPSRDVIVWEDGESLDRDDDWTEFTLNCNTRGKALWLEIPTGKVQLDWAEVVFENGDTRVVDFGEMTKGSGLYSLLEFADGRKVDHVRVVARAKTEEAKVVLRMQKE